MQLDWIKCTGEVWCGLMTVDLNHNHFKNLMGVYIVWSGNQTIRLGSGIIRDRLEEHRNSAEINKFPNLMVTWAQVNKNQMEGVEKFLSDNLNPVIGERFPNRTPISVNFPW